MNAIMTYYHREADVNTSASLIVKAMIIGND